MAKHILLLTALVVGLLSGPALAGPIVSFSANAGGTISYAGGGSDVVGANITIDTVTGIGTPQHSGNPGPSVTQGTLNFTTGNLVSFSSGVYTFGAGGTFTITGGVPAASIANGTILLSGQLSTAAVDVSSSSVYLFTGSGSDTPNQALLAYFGLTGASATLGQVTIHISPTTACGPCGRSTPFGGSAFSIYVPDAPTPVPEPGTLALLGSGLLGIATAAGRRFVRT